MSTTTVTISSVVYDVYIDDAEAQTYLGGRLGTGPWDVATTDNKKRALVTATRLLDRQRWQGAKSVSSDPLAWPRTGVIDATGAAVSSVDQPVEIDNATAELALMILEDSTVETMGAEGSNIKRMRVGSGASAAEAEFFRPTGRGKPLPGLVMELVGQYLETTVNDLRVPQSFGTEEVSSFDDETLDRDTPVG